MAVKGVVSYKYEIEFLKRRIKELEVENEKLKQEISRHIKAKQEVAKSLQRVLSPALQPAG